MKRLITLITLLSFVTAISCAQADSSASSEMPGLKQQLKNAGSDTSQAFTLASLSYFYAYSNYDSSLLYAEKALKLSNKINYARGRANALLGFGNLYLRQGDFPLALQYQFEALELCEKFQFEREKAISLMELGFTYGTLSDNVRSMAYAKQARDLFSKNSWDNFNVENEISITNVYMATGKKDSALLCMQKVYEDPKNQVLLHIILEVLGNIHTSLGNFTVANEHLHRTISLDIKKNDLYSLIFAYNSIAKLFKATKQTDSCIYYATKGFIAAENIRLNEGLLITSLLLTNEIESSNIVKALFYRKKYDEVYNKMYGPEKVLALQKTLVEQQEKERQVTEDRKANENRLKQYAFLSGLVILLLVALFLYRNNRQKQKANKVLETTLNNLKSTQTQLIQSEKMASLGELTAGIAHEIQNPLNFVNNFSEVSSELISEMLEEVDKGNYGEVKAIADDVKQNLDKINHHGKRAGDIVKGMLQHSRSSSGVKEPTDINALCDEYLRLSYHGLRAKDKSFNATIKTDFDPTIGNINIIPQDIGRVVLNLLTNAFYAVGERSKAGSPDQRFGVMDEKKNASTSSAGQPYEPTVSISTKKVGEKAFISVQDNGNGIPKKALDKIFQPFFTTKPTGQGTGLGLSLSYDIIKAHNGEIKVETNEGRGSLFVIQISTI